MRRRFLLFGATGSIGSSTLDILRQRSDDFELVGFTWHNNEQKAHAIQREFGVEHAFSTNTKDAEENTARLLDIEHDFIIVAIVGAAGVHTTYEAAKRGERILLANKESLVIAGDTVMATVRKNGATMLPVDSEHSSLFRLLEKLPSAAFQKVYLTASGGPLLHLSGDDFYHASRDIVLKHPTWVMGPKITVDSAGLTNKALEVIEAHHLFNLPYEKISAVVHPQSYVHAIVVGMDGTLVQHVSPPDMRYPIAHAMYYPDASPDTVNSHEVFSYPALEFFPVDKNKFRSYALGVEAGTKGEYFPCVFNAANEAAVQAFLEGNISFGQIAELIESALDAKYPKFETSTIEGLLEYDSAARKVVAHHAMSV